MDNQRIMKWLGKLPSFLFPFLLLFPLTLHASFIESTIGTAVVNDATAIYYNPGALTLLKNPQIITLGSAGAFHTRFTGQTIQTRTGFTQTGSSTTQSTYYLPSIYLAIPTTKKITVGLAVVSNLFSGNIDENSILRYTQSSNSIQDIDFIPAVGIKINKFFSVGAGLNFSYAKFILRPISGLPSLNIPDTQSRNESNATALGGNVGILLTPNDSTLIGVNYRSAMTYQLSGSSIFEGNPEIISNHYHFIFWTPARSVISLSYSITPNLGFISTIQRIQWSVFRNVNIHNIATQIGIINATVPYHLRDTWLLTLGTQYRITPKWIVRVAGSYNQSPGNGNYQIAEGNSFILGASTAYEICKNFLIDASYAHAFMQNASIHIANTRNIINGVNTGFRDGVALKLTFNL